MYEKHGQPLETVIKNVIQTKFIRPKERPYQTENFYARHRKTKKTGKGGIGYCQRQNHKTMKSPAEGPVKRKLTRAEKKGNRRHYPERQRATGNPTRHSRQFPTVQMYPDGICKVSEKKYSKSIVFEDINYQLAQADDKTAIFENWCDFLNYFDASVSVQLSFINQGARKGKGAGGHSKSRSRTTLLTLSVPSMRIC